MQLARKPYGDRKLREGNAGGLGVTEAGNSPGQCGVLHENGGTRRKPHPVLLRLSFLHQGKDVGPYLNTASEARGKSFEVFNLGRISGHPSMHLSKWPFLSASRGTV